MDGFKSMIRAVCIISAAICLIEQLTSGTRFRNQMKFLLNMIFVMVIAAPFAKGTLEFELPDINKYLMPDSSESQEIYHDELERQTSENISAVLMEQINAAGINCTGIEMDINISETNSISISSVTVESDNFEAAAEIIRNSLGAETEVLNGNT